MDNNQTQIATRTGTQVQLSREKQEQFIAACKRANELQLADNVEYVFAASAAVQTLRNILTQDVVETYFMPLMGTRIGFLTDRDKEVNGKKPVPYGWETIRDCVIDGACKGLAPIQNQINIIAGNMYPTKEGFTALLKKIGVKYIINKGPDTSAPTSTTASIACKIFYEYKGEKKDYTLIATPKKNQYSSLDQLQGKAERKAKKHLYEYLTGIDLGDADEDGVDEQPQPSVQDRKETLRQNRQNNQQPEDGTLL